PPSTPHELRVVMCEPRLLRGRLDYDRHVVDVVRPGPPRDRERTTAGPRLGEYPLEAARDALHLRVLCARREPHAVEMRIGPDDFAPSADLDPVPRSRRAG